MEAAKILTVDDDPLVQFDLRQILERAGFIVCSTARDGVEAVERAREHKPDLIVMDIGLPRLDGVAATERILEERDVPVVALTGRSDRAALLRAADAGAVRHIVKPFSETVLVETLSDVLAERHARREQEFEHHHLRVMIEAMSRRGCSEREIAAAVEEATGTRTASPRCGNLKRRLGGRLGWRHSVVINERDDP
jgi:response regulator NasT